MDAMPESAKLAEPVEADGGGIPVSPDLEITKY
jgi:hypothetical protein